MTTKHEHYLFIGWRIGYKAFHRNVMGADDITSENDADYRLIVDGMNSKYVVFGTVLAEGGMFEGFDFTIIPEVMEKKFKGTGVDKWQIEAETTFAKMTGTALRDLTEGESPRLILFTHFH